MMFPAMELPLSINISGDSFLFSDRISFCSFSLQIVFNCNINNIFLTSIHLKRINEREREIKKSEKERKNKEREE